MIPEILLAWTKDIRYIKDCQDSLRDLLSGILSVDETDTWFASLIMYTALVLVRNKQTAGMEVVGLEFSKETTRWKLGISAFLVASSIYWYKKRIVTIDHEQLTGEARRRVFEEQRRTSGRAPLTIQQGSSRSLREKLTNVLKKYADSLADTLLSLNELPPHLSESELRIPPGTVGSMIARLGLGYLCLTGKMPFPLNALPLCRFSNDPSKSKLVHRPKSYKIIGLLILLEAFGKGLDICIKFLAASAKRRQVSHRGINVSNTLGNELSEDNIHSLPLCEICRTPRLRPACPIGCGHVFCWDCLLQWTSQNHECPYCRKACEPQDLVPLCSYQFPSNS